jgi:hypothetical protein
MTRLLLLDDDYRSCESLDASLDACRKAAAALRQVWSMPGSRAQP